MSFRRVSYNWLNDKIANMYVYDVDSQSAEPILQISYTYGNVNFPNLITQIQKVKKLNGGAVETTVITYLYNANGTLASVSRNITVTTPTNSEVEYE